MELVDGPTLADRLMRGPLPLDEAVPIAKQIAEALEAAHEQGIIHRDLKPANIKVRADGTVKVLDFGLAKALEADSGIPQPEADNVSKSPTVTSPALTLRGVILGTAAYMSPEQVKGRAVDRRSDIWAFGCVLFEVLTGRRAFNGDDVPDTMVAVLSKEPDWHALPAAAAPVCPLIFRCLKRDPKQRLQAIGDARIQLDELTSGTAEWRMDAAAKPAAPGISRLVAVAAGTAVLVALTTWLVARPAPGERARPTRFEIIPPAPHALAIQDADRNLAVSPDGQTIVYRAGAQAELVVRAFERFDGRVLKGTVNARSPFFSPDSQWIGFFDGTEH